MMPMIETHHQDRDDLVPRRGVAGQQRQREADEAVRAHLQQNAGQDHGAGRGRFGVRVRQPGVEREHRHLDGEREEEAPEQKHLQWRGELRHGGQQRGNVERVRLPVTSCA